MLNKAPSWSRTIKVQPFLALLQVQMLGILTAPCRNARIADGCLLLFLYLEVICLGMTDVHETNFVSQ
jgi:hypothetical protein